LEGPHKPWFSTFIIDGLPAFCKREGAGNFEHLLNVSATKAGPAAMTRRVVSDTIMAKSATENVRYESEP
jgi:hypothetical protein